MVKDIVTDGSQNGSLDHAKAPGSNHDHVYVALFRCGDDRLAWLVLRGSHDDLAVLQQQQN